MITSIRSSTVAVIGMSAVSWRKGERRRAYTVLISHKHFTVKHFVVS
jgi:hypothetical protein